jgi:biofilm PGA synthesis lipoprotein PgaB
VDLEREITIRNQNLSDNDRPQKIMHVDLDYVYDPDPAQQERNLAICSTASPRWA